MELTTSWKEEGRLEGQMQGRQEGRLEEGRQLVARLLHRRFGHVNPVLISRMQSPSREDVERLGEDLLDFQTLEDLENWFQRHAS